MHPSRWIPVALTLTFAVLPGCDVLNSVVSTVATTGVVSDDPELSAFLGDSSEPDEGQLDGVSGLAPVKVTRSAAIKRQPAGDIQAGDSVTVMAVSSPFLRSYSWQAYGGTLRIKDDTTAFWTPSTRSTSVLKLTARTLGGGKAVFYLVAFTNGQVVKFREASVQGSLPAGWLQANDPFKAASPSPAVSPSPSPITPAPVVSKAPENLAEVPACGSAGAVLSLQEYYSQWQSYFNAHQWAQAACSMRQAVQAYPNEAWMHLYLAYATAQLGAFAEAMPELEKARQLAPSDSDIVANEAFLYHLYSYKLSWENNRYRWVDAAYWSEKAVAVKPGEWSYWAQLGIVSGNVGQTQPGDVGLNGHEAALRAWKQAYTLSSANAVNGPNFKACCEWGIPKLRAGGRTDKAIEYAELAVQAFPAEAAFKSMLVDLYLATNQAAKAESLLASLPDGPSKDVLRGIVQFSHGDEAGAEATFAAASRSYPSNYDVDVQISTFYRNKVEALPYTDQMASPYQDEVVLYATNSVTKYFQQHPYTQTRTYYPPLRGDFTLAQKAGGKSFHYGISSHYAYDLTNGTANAMGTPIYAVAAGTVKTVVVSNADRALGSPVDFSAQPNMIEIDHGNGQFSRYLHIKQNSSTLHVGQAVAAGQKIAEIGNTGITTGPHLHFELRDGTAALPIKFTGLKQGSTTVQMFGDVGAYNGTGP